MKILKRKANEQLLLKRVEIKTFQECLKEFDDENPPVDLADQYVSLPYIQYKPVKETMNL